MITILYNHNNPFRKKFYMIKYHTLYVSVTQPYKYPVCDRKTEKKKKLRDNKSPFWTPPVTSGKRRQCPSYPSVVFHSKVLFPLDFLDFPHSLDFLQFILPSPVVSSTGISAIPKWHPS